MKLRVLVIGINLKNRVAGFGEKIDSSELPNPEMLKQLMSKDDPYLEQWKESKAEKTKREKAEKAEKAKIAKAAREAKVAEFEKLDLEGLLKFAEDKKIVITTKGKDKKATVINEIIDAQEVE